MKKRVGIILSVILASTMAMTPVYATENIDLDSMSVEDLVALQKEISEKLEEKGEDENAWGIIPRGIYKVGTDIKAGNFEFIAYDEGVSISTFDSEEGYEDYDTLDYDWLDYDEKTGDRDRISLKLSDGQIVAIEYGSAFIKEVTNASWMPD